MKLDQINEGIDLAKDFSLSCVAPEISRLIASNCGGSTTIRMSCAVLRIVPADLISWYDAFPKSIHGGAWMFSKGSEVLKDFEGSKFLMSGVGDTFIPYLYFDGMTGTSPENEALKAIDIFETKILPSWHSQMSEIGISKDWIAGLKFSHYLQKGEMSVTVVKNENGVWNSFWLDELYQEAKFARYQFGGVESPWLSLNAAAYDAIKPTHEGFEEVVFLDPDESDSFKFRNYCFSRKELSILR